MAINSKTGTYIRALALGVLFCLVLALFVAFRYQSVVGIGSGAKDDTSDAVEKNAAAPSQSASSVNALARSRSSALKTLTMELRAMEAGLVVDRHEVTVELPVSDAMRQRRKLSPEQSTISLDVKYRILVPPTPEIKARIEKTVASLQRESGGVDSETSRALAELAADYLNFTKSYKLLVLTKPQDAFGKNNLTIYNTDKLMEFDDGKSLTILPDDVEACYVQYGKPYEAITRYGHLFQLKE